jgi:hypothetical protein
VAGRAIVPCQTVLACGAHSINNGGIRKFRIRIVTGFATQIRVRTAKGKRVRMFEIGDLRKRVDLTMTGSTIQTKTALMNILMARLAVLGQTEKPLGPDRQYFLSRIAMTALTTHAGVSARKPEFKTGMVKSSKF